jgi:hypothetical protein
MLELAAKSDTFPAFGESDMDEDDGPLYHRQLMWTLRDYSRMLANIFRSLVGLPRIERSEPYPDE